MDEMKSDLAFSLEAQSIWATWEMIELPKAFR